MLYKSECTEMGKEQNTFLNQLKFQKITDDEKKRLDSPLTAGELIEAIGDINGGKAPRPDGLPIEFYKTF